MTRSNCSIWNCFAKIRHQSQEETTVDLLKCCYAHHKMVLQNQHFFYSSWLFLWRFSFLVLPVCLGSHSDHFSNVRPVFTLAEKINHFNDVSVKTTRVSRWSESMKQALRLYFACFHQVFQQYKFVFLQQKKKVPVIWWSIF